MKTEKPSFLSSLATVLAAAAGNIKKAHVLEGILREHLTDWLGSMRKSERDKLTQRDGYAILQAEDGTRSLPIDIVASNGWVPVMQSDAPGSVKHACLYATKADAIHHAQAYNPQTSLVLKVVPVRMLYDLERTVTIEHNRLSAEQMSAAREAVNSFPVPQIKQAIADMKRKKRTENKP